MRVDKGSGVPGRTMAEWLIEKGIDQPKADRPPGEKVRCRLSRFGASCSAAARALVHSGVQLHQHPIRSYSASLIEGLPL